MKAKHWGILTILGLLLIIVAVRFFLFEKVEVPDLNWQSRYSTKTNHPYDISLFRKLLDQRYSQVEDWSYYQLSDEESDVSGKTFFVINPNEVFNKDQYEILTSLARRGTHVITFGTYFGYKSDEYGVYSTYDYLTDSVHFFFNEKKYTCGPPPQHLDQGTYWGGINTIDCHTDDSDCQNSRIAIQAATRYNDSLHYQVMMCIDHAEGSNCYHAAPQLIYNLSQTTEVYLPHFNYLTTLFDDPTAVVVQIDQYSSGDGNPMRYLLDLRGMRWALYALLLASLLYIWNSRRRLRPVPVIHAKENTTMDFVETVSRLYRSRQAYERIASRMIDNFHHHNRERYHLHATDEHYYTQVARVSKVDPQVLRRIEAFALKQYAGKSARDIYQELHQYLTQYYNTAL